MTQPTRKDRLPDVDERMTDDQDVFRPGPGHHLPGEPMLLGPRRQVVDEDADTAVGGGSGLGHQGREVVDAAQVLDHDPCHA